MMHTPIYPNPKTNVGRMLVTKKVVHVPDLATEPAYVERREPGIVAVVEVGRARTALYVPILRENELVGAFLLARGEVRPFTSKQIELVEKLRSPSSSRHRERIPARERRNYSTFLKRTKVKLNGSFAR